MTSFETFERFVDPLPDALLIVSLDGVVRAANRAFREMLRIDEARLVRRPLADMSPRPEQVVAALRAASRTTSLAPAVVTLRDGDGVDVACHLEGALLRGRNGDEPLVLLRLAPQASRVTRFVELNRRIEGLVHEVSVRRRVERQLWEQREWLRTTLRSIGDAVIATTGDGLISFMNPVAEMLLGRSEAEVSGRPLTDVFAIFNEHTRAPVENPVERVMRDGKVVGLANHTVLRRPDGSEIAIDDSAAPIRARDGSIVGIVMIFHDVSDKRALERELRAQLEKLAEADRRKDEFLAMLAHELRNPLAPILNAVQIARMRPEPARVDAVIDVIERQTRHLSRLVDDLLDVARITRGAIQLQVQPVDLASVLRAAVESCDIIASLGHHVDVRLPAEPVIVVGDPVRLEQAVTNLLQNAAKFTAAGGRIRLELSRTPTVAVAEVVDTGIGIEPEMLERVFDVFVQADPSLARSRGGLGIGLTLVRRVVEMHGGSVAAESAGLGMGSRFIVTLPLAEDGRRQAEAPPPEPDVAPRRILVVDDNEDAVEMLATYLQMRGHHVETAFDGASALEAARRMQPEIAFLDIGLPDMDGYEVARTLRAEPGGSTMLLVALSGYGQPEDRRKSREAGFDQHRVKPVDPSVPDRVIATTPPSDARA